MNEQEILPTTTLRKLRATAIKMELEEPEEYEDCYPDGHWVYAKTDLIFPSRILDPDSKYDDDEWCVLRSPGEQAGGKTGEEEIAVFERQAVYLTRMLSYLGIPIIAEEAAA
jgi:hypothetical protein